MRHRKKLNHLGRTSSHRKAMLANMASSLILHKRISTTLAKAKALRVYVEPLITKSKSDSTHSRRTVFSYLKDKVAVSELFREVSPKVADRPGGYTRILKTGSRLGDNADMCIIELVDFNENMLEAQKESKTASKRSRRGRGKKSSDTAEAGAAGKQEKTASKKGADIDQKTSEKEAEKAEAVKGETPGADEKEVVTEETAVEEKPAAEAAVEDKPVAETAVEEKPEEETAVEDKPSEVKESKDKTPETPEADESAKDKKKEDDDNKSEKPAGE
ncbi:MAG: 50S ribosomal protein L17 [Bacteroidales bacterium]